MPDPNLTDNKFLQQITRVIEDNITNEQFGVSELAQEIGMSRSNLLRKLKKITDVSVSQYIRQMRLQKSMELLKEGSRTISEVSYEVGFGSTSYFIKCFREYYGYPPGEAESRYFDESQVEVAGKKSHQLVAIMFTDIEGYTALMQKNELQALELRQRHREVFDSITSKFNGKILQYYGDGTLSIFYSAIDAVKCGIELQQAFLLSPQIPVRVGIHTGDIIINNEDIIGDGVNVASRIESLAMVGSVLISEKVYDEIKNQPGIKSKSLGTYKLKNVEKALEVFAISNPGLVVPKREQIKGKLKKGFTPKSKLIWILWTLIALLLSVSAYMVYKTEGLRIPSDLSADTITLLPEKSIAVLPFRNDSSDSTNVFIVNGLMESILNHLQKIKDLRVISRTSVEKYRNTTMIVPEIAKELDVSYFVEGSGQKIGDQILLNIQLIEAVTDRHLWSEQYDRGTEDIFQLQREVAKKIADEIEAIITPEEEERINEIPTQNIDAYQAYLKGRELFHQGDKESLEQAILYYEQAIQLDGEFAHAYAGLSIVYYFLDFYHSERQFDILINSYADKAMLYDPNLPQSLIAKSLFYIQNAEYDLALPHLEKALEYNPNSALVINILSDFYTRYVPNTEKYLEYALMGLKIDVGTTDSINMSFTYLHLGNAFIQSGFVKEAEHYINRSLEYNPDNLYSAYVKAFIMYAKNRKLGETKSMLIETLQRDTTRLDLLQETAKICYFMRDYEEAYSYYSKFIELKEKLNLDIYHVENAKIAMVMKKMGDTEEAEKYIRKFRDYLPYDQSIYQNINQAMLSAYEGKIDDAMLSLKEFAKEDNYNYWILLFYEQDPIIDELKNHKDFKKVMKGIEDKFWKYHEDLNQKLEEQRLI